MTVVRTPSPRPCSTAPYPRCCIHPSCPRQSAEPPAYPARPTVCRRPWASRWRSRSRRGSASALDAREGRRVVVRVELHPKWLDREEILRLASTSTAAIPLRWRSSSTSTWSAYVPNTSGTKPSAVPRLPTTIFDVGAERQPRESPCQMDDRPRAGGNCRRCTRPWSPAQDAQLSRKAPASRGRPAPPRRAREYSRSARGRTRRPARSRRGRAPRCARPAGRARNRSSACCPSRREKIDARDRLRHVRVDAPARSR